MEEKMSTTIVAEAETLEEARKILKSKIPEGYFVLSENVISDGKPKSIRAAAETLGAAFAKAESEIPDDAMILEKKEINAPQVKVIILEAPDEQSARSQSQAEVQIGREATTRSVRLVVAGKKGFLGIGTKINKYEVELLLFATIKITYKTKAKISPKIITDIASLEKLAPKFRQEYDDGNFDGVISDLSPVLENIPSGSELRRILSSVYSDRGTIKYSKRDLAGARADFEAAISANPQNYRALWNCGQCCKEQGDRAEFISYSLAAEKINPEFAAKMSQQLLDSYKNARR